MLQLHTVVDGRTIQTRLHNYGPVPKQYGGYEDYSEGYLDGDTEDIRFLAERKPEILVLLDELGNEFEVLAGIIWSGFEETYPGHAIVYVRC